MNIISVDAKPEKGFNFGYMLRLPDKFDTSKPITLVAEMNNTGPVDVDPLSIKECTANEIEKSCKSFLFDELNMPYLIPLFSKPRVDRMALETHSLCRRTLLHKGSGLERIDKQFINMVRDAQNILRDQGVNVDEKFVLHGFSSSGSFANRFSLMYPELLKCVVAGGMSTAVIPLRKYNDVDLTYPVGVADFEEILGIKFDLDKYLELPQFIYCGDQNNENDTLLWKTCIDPERANLFREVLGYLPKSARMENQRLLFESLGYDNIVVKVFKNEGHRPQLDFVKSFLIENVNDIGLKKPR